MDKQTTQVEHAEVVRHPAKVFGIGLSKTGTTSLAAALALLGFRTKDYMGATAYVPSDLSSIDLAVIDAHDAFTDTPIPSFYQELDAHYPNSRFILTVRDKQAWLKSCKKQFTPRFAEKQKEAEKRIFFDLYGAVAFDEEKFSHGYDQFVSGVMDYFKERPKDLLILDVAAGDGWQALSRFLGIAVPDRPFPKANVSEFQWLNIREVVATAQRAGDAVMKEFRWVRRAANGGGDAPEDRSVVRAIHGVAASLHRIARGDEHAALRRAQVRSRAVIEAQLKALTPSVPVIARGGVEIPHRERRHWNHLWLVDPLDGTDQFLRGDPGFSINLALVQDGVPILGVVISPANGQVYFFRAGSGSFVQVGNEEPQKLSDVQNGGVQGRQEPNQTSLSAALAICRAAEVGTPTPYRLDGEAWEWQTAAAHAVVSGVGRRLVECEGGAALAYNAENLNHGCVVVT